MSQQSPVEERIDVFPNYFAMTPVASTVVSPEITDSGYSSQSGVTIVASVSTPSSNSQVTVISPSRGSNEEEPPWMPAIRSLQLQHEERMQLQEQRHEERMQLQEQRHEERMQLQEQRHEERMQLLTKEYNRKMLDLRLEVLHLRGEFEERMSRVEQAASECRALLTHVPNLALILRHSDNVLPIQRRQQARVEVEAVRHEVRPLFG